MSEMKELKRFIYSATVTSGSGSQSFYIDAESREEADARAANNESDGMYADDSEVTDLDALDYEDETTVDDFGDFPLISREQSLIAQLEAAQQELIKPLPIGELVHRLEGQTYEKWFSESDVKDLRERAETAEAALSAANDKLNKPVVLPPRRSASSFVDEEFSNKDLAAIYNAARVEFSVKITNAGFTVEGGDNG
ncbi:hypothetical protein [Yersinia intermedia]|uniref:hypothetical protein n=1 Tax=Yersinia intermedia TaxID=631 RepID=UPI0011A90D69|nr:hypothetical protein [Yersinia intermedia]